MNKRTIWDNDEAASNERERRRFAAEERAFDRLDKQMDEAEPLIGELMREGKTVYYINLKDRNGRPTGKTKEGTRADLIAYLLRNHYVH